MTIIRCFDAGHANVMAQGKCAWIPWCCSTGRVPWNNENLDRMLPNIVTTHLHANYGDNDSHDLPSRGNVDWKSLLAKLAAAPRLRTHQHEVARDHGYSPKVILDDFAEVLGSCDAPRQEPE